MAPPREVVMEMLSERYGWTPAEIKEISETDMANYLAIISIKNRIELDAQKRNHGKR